MKLLHKLKLDDLTGEQRELAETIGIDAYIKLVDAYGGSNIYIQKPDTVTRDARNSEICENFNGYNYRQLARRYDVTEKTIREIVGGGRASREIPGQKSIFDE